MKTKKIWAILCSSLLFAMLLSGCFPFSLFPNSSESSNIGIIGGADGPTAVYVAVGQETNSDNVMQNDDFFSNFDFDDLDYDNASDDNYDDYDEIETDFDDIFDDSSDEYYDDDNPDYDSLVNRIGSAETGYVDVPSDFVPFYDVAGLAPGTIQYSDASMLNIFTLMYFDETTIDPYSFAFHLMEQLSNDSSVDQTSVTGAIAELDDLEAYQVYCYYPDDDVFVVTWTFDSPDDEYTHYLSVEFTSDNFHLFEMMEDTYHLAY